MHNTLIMKGINGYMNRLMMGSVEVISLTDTELDLPLLGVFPTIQMEQWLAYRAIAQTSSGNRPASERPAFTSIEQETIHVRIGAFLVRSPEYTILVDTGLGLGSIIPAPPSLPAGLSKFFSGLPIKLLEELHSFGVEPDDVDMVFLTHAHSDHYGWTLNREQEPIFPHARYLLSKTDWEAFQQPTTPARLRWGLDQFVTPLMTHRVLDLTIGEQPIANNIRALPTPGHTPGHQSLLIDAGGKQALIGGDTFIHPLQVSDATLSFNTDMDRAQTIATRQRLREWIERDGILLASNHILGSGIGRIQRDSHQYFWQEEALAPAIQEKS